MNNRGVLFSLMIFILLGTLLALHQISFQQENILKEGISEANAFKKVSDKYANIKNNFTVLTTSAAEKEIDQRILPFNYTIDSNSFDLNTTLPLRQAKIDSYMEILKAFELFLEDTNYSNEFDSMHVDINTLTPASWGGNDTNISFIIRPQCLKYSFYDETVLEFDFVCNDYNYSTILRQDVNITLQPAHDFNALACNFNGAATCFNNDFDPGDTNPYVSVNIFDSSCFNCQLNQTSIRGHFNPDLDSNITLSCTGAGCTTPNLTMDFSNKTRVEFTGTVIELLISIDLNSGIESLSFNDANILVENRYFGSRRWN